MVLTSLWWGTTERLCFRDGTAIEANTAHYNIKEAKIQPFTARHMGGAHSYGPLLTSPSPQHRSEPEFRCQWVGLDAPWSYWARGRTKLPFEPL